ncbi:hypothetical protein, partial [Prevotella pallens]|uniref:hypothetical protein n=1 Tax=Prevotella pallens TaxID=60133 RepID=UPI003C789FF0
SFYRIHIFILPNIYIHIIGYAYIRHRTRIFVPHFVGVYRYVGTINRPLQQLTDCQNIANEL